MWPPRNIMSRVLVYRDVYWNFVAAMLYQPYMPEINKSSLFYSSLVSVLTLISDGCSRSGKESKGSGACKSLEPLTKQRINV